MLTPSLAEELASRRAFLDNIETSGLGNEGSSTPQSPTAKVFQYHREGRKLSRALGAWLKRHEQKTALMPEYKENDDAPLKVARSIRRAINRCMSNILVAGPDTGSVSYAGGMRCRNRNCPNCNKARAARQRKAVRLMRAMCPELRINYDMLHLTLTVPRFEGKAFGVECFVSELLDLFNKKLRKAAFWKEDVSGGYGTVECTVATTDHEGRPDSGYHYHLHCLLFVPKGTRRNMLYMNILKAWNAATAPYGHGHAELSPERLAGLRKSVPKEYPVPQLDARGATLIGLESLYVLRKGKKCYKLHTEDDVAEAMQEVLKYHFEPLSLKKEDGEYNPELLINLAIALKGKRLFNRFGMMQSTAKFKSPYSKFLNAMAKLDELATPDEMATDDPAQADAALAAERTGAALDAGSETPESQYEPDQFFLVATARLRFNPLYGCWQIPKDSLPLPTDRLEIAFAMMKDFCTSSPKPAKTKTTQTI